MHKSILASAVALACGMAFCDTIAENATPSEWQAIVRGATSTGYADTSSIRRSGTIVTMRVLVDYPKPPFDGNNLQYRSLTMRNEYDCGQTRFRVLSITSHSGNMAQGERPYTTDETGEWEAISPHTVQRALWHRACATGAATQP
jgi:hypothetical protein